MARVKRGVTARRRHKKVLAMTKGHRGTKHLLYRRAHESMLHALSYAYRHRRERKGDFRRMWILRIGAATRQYDLPYNSFIHGLKLANVQLDRKVMAYLAIQDNAAFTQLVEVAKSHLTATKG